jgi:phospholipid/cholesterol/gamma-HCH transport system substrate-binding protein
MIRMSTKVRVLIFMVVSFLGITYVGVNYIGLFSSGFKVYAELADAGGLFANAPVTYRGVPVGRVTSMTLHDGGARATLRIDKGVTVPVDLRAVVSQRSAVGEQYLDLRPESDGGPFLKDGAVIPRDRTGIPLAPETLLANLDKLVDSVNPADLAVVIDELGTAFEGSELALRTILDSGQLLLNDAVESLPQTVRLLRDGRTVLGTQADSLDEIRTWADGLAKLAATLRSSDADLRKLIAAGPPAANELVALLDDLEPTVGTLLGNLISVTGVATRRLPGIRQVLVEFPIAVSGGFTLTPGDGTAHLGLVVNVSDPPSCVYHGSLKCSAADEAAGASVRGTGNAPRPGGDPRPPQQPSDGSQAVSYDLPTGLVLGPDGLPLQFGSTGGQAKLAGEQSWKQLLLAGLAP